MRRPSTGKLAAVLIAGVGCADEPPTLTRIQDEVFTPSCTFSSCHAAPGASGLVLEEGVSFGALVDVESAAAPGRILVVPGDAEGSYLVAKIRGDAGIVGTPMPQPVGPLDAARAQWIVDWIDDGARDD